MNEYSITFILNNSEHVTVQSEYPLNEWNCCSDATVVLLFDKTEYRFFIHDIQRHMLNFSEQLKKTIANELPLHESIQQDIGYVWNESYWEKPGLVYEGAAEEAKLWIGFQLRIWSSREQNKALSVWLYNDEDGKIVLEITPDYPWYDCDPAECKEFVPYEEWIKSYKPLIIRIIPKDIAQKWIKQANNIITKIDENIL